MTEKEIKDKLKSVNDTVKITRAMQMLATTRAYRAQKSEDSARSYYEMVDSALKNMFNANNKDSVLLHEGNGFTALVVIAGDKGLCGDYNNAVFAVADKEIESIEKKFKMYSVGFVAREYYRAKGIHTDNSFVYVVNEPTVKDAMKMAEELIKSFINDGLKEIKIVYTEYLGNSTAVRTERLLPYSVEATEINEDTMILGDIDLDIVLKQHLSAKLYYIFATSSNAVNYKRMMAMREATTNGEEMVDDLTKAYNRTRQNKITNELNDSVAALFGKKYE